MPPTSSTAEPALRQRLLRKARESAETKLACIEENAEALERCAREMAQRFQAGGRLWTMGNGGSACDAQHLAVEFQHPVIERRRALPALALTTDSAMLTAVGNDRDYSRVFVEQLECLARPGDMALGLSSSGASANVLRALRRARELDLLAIGLAGRDGGRMPELCHHCFTVKSWSIHRIQETHTLLLHLLWDLVHLSLGEDDVL